MHKLLGRALALWLPIAVATSGLFLFAYWGIQQEYRMSLSDPQVQIAEDAAAALASGTTPAALVRGMSSVDIRASLAPWVAVYNASGTPLAGTATLDGAPAQLPLGVFNGSSWHTYAEMGVPLSVPIHEDRFSWQPRGDVRQAVVLVAVGNGEFVASGRNMRETESRVQTFTQGAALAWGATELGTLVVIFIILALGWL
jgi:hypothetical protein